MPPNPLRDRVTGVLSGAFAVSVAAAPGIIFYETGDVAHNREVAPTGVWAGGGWEYAGFYGNFLGTMISPRHFITANHISAGPTVFVHKTFFSGEAVDVTYHINPNFNGGTGRLNIAGTDLRILEVYEEFPAYAPLYTSSNEVGKALVVHGRGRARAEAVESSGQPRGWLWATSGRRSRWGANEVDSVDDGGASLGELLVFDFSPVTGQEECQLSSGDSGGGMFIKDGATWKLAGVNYGVDAFYDTNSICEDGSEFNAAMFDATGFYFGKDCDWELITSGDDTVQSRSFISRISASATAIQNVIQPAIDAAALSPIERYEVWIADFGVTAETQPGENADEDPWYNLVEYLAAGDPSANGDVPPFKVMEGDGVVRFEVRERLDVESLGLSWEITGSTTMIPGSFAAVGGLLQVSATVSLAEGVRTLLYEIPMPSADGTFYRLEVSLAP